jgi:hypothetical protein
VDELAKKVTIDIIVCVNKKPTFFSVLNMIISTAIAWPLGGIAI